MINLFYFSGKIYYFFHVWQVKMNKSELVEKISEKIDLNRKETEVIVNTFFDCITDALSQGKKVELRGFGSFKIKKRKRSYVIIINKCNNCYEINKK